MKLKEHEKETAYDFAVFTFMHGWKSGECQQIV